MEQHRFIKLCNKGDLIGLKHLLQLNPDIISADNEHAFRNACLHGKLDLCQWLLKQKPDINISADNEHAFRNACFYGHLHVAQWLLQINPYINISADNEDAFWWACRNRHLDVAHWLQSLKPYLYVIEYDENGKYKGYKIREKEEANWERRKYLVWLASNHCPEENKTNLLYRLPTDVAKMVLQFV